jgi:PrcB C-terminal
VRAVARSAWIAAAALVVVACGSSHALAYQNLSGQLRSPEFPRSIRAIFRSRADLHDYLAHAMPGRAPALPPIDFVHREAILIASGPRSSTGYALRVMSVRDSGNRITVIVDERTPKLGQHVTPRITYPFLLLTVPRSGKRLSAHYAGRP